MPNVKGYHAKLIPSRHRQPQSALASLEAGVRLVDDVDAALTANEPVVAMAQAQRTQGVLDLHDSSPISLMGRSVSDLRTEPKRLSTV